MKHSLKMALAMMIALVASLSTCGAVSDYAAVDNFTLEIFGNANMDDTIDEKDVTYVEGVVKGANAATNLSDADYNGKIDEKDITQIKLIIAGDEKELTFIDWDGIAVTIKKPVNKIVTCGSNHVFEAIRVLKAEDQIVGMETNDLVGYGKEFLSKSSSIPSIGSSSEPDFEKIIEQKPDIVIATPRGSVDFEDKLKGTDIQVVHMRLSDTGSVLRRIMIFGYLLDKRDEAQAYKVWHDNLTGYFKEKLSAIPRNGWPKVFWLRTGQTTCTRNSSYQRTLEMAGGLNIAEDLPSQYPAFDQEWLVEENPDVILGLITSGMKGSGRGYDLDSDNLTLMKTVYEEIIGAPEYKNINAVNDERVFITNASPMLGAGYFVGVAYIAKWLHPDIFSDLDPQEIHKEYLNTFQGIDYDLDKYGAFVYPKPV